MRLQRNILLPACITVAFALSAPAADVTGKWKAVFDTSVGRYNYTFEFKVEGEKLTGKAYMEWSDEKEEVDLLEGKVNGTQISFVEIRPYRWVLGRKTRYDYAGKINGYEITFTRKVSTTGTTEQLVAKRVKG
jgi:hypothetical protein